MSARHLVIGLDGADVDVIDGLGDDALPAIAALRRRGAWARLESVQPPATLPNWTTFLTGVDPGRHGVFDFTTRDGYRVAFTAGTVREAPTIAARLDAMGWRCACVGFPGTWPPEPLANGVFVSGWDSPVAFEADRSFVHPPSLHDAMTARFGPMRFDDVDELAAGKPGWHQRLPGLLTERVEHKTELARWLLGREAWDLFAFYFGESDTAAHHLWAFHDPRSPRHRPGAPFALANVYRALDRAVARLVAEAGEDVEVTLVSDHGSGGSGTTVLYLNRLLAELGSLTFAPGGSRAVSLAKDLALTALPPRARQAVFSLAGRALPGLVESRARFGGIDFSQTRAFSDELNYFPGVWLNQVGREPKGFVRAADRDAVRRDVAQALKALRDPWTGQPVVVEAWPREELYEGPFLDRAPDLVLRLALRDGYSWNLLPSNGPGPVFTQLPPEEHLGRKGRSLPGSHRERGFFVAAGPRVAATGEVDAHIADASATMLARLDVAPPPDAAGRVLFEILDELGTSAASLPDAELVRGAGDEAEVEARLRALGYVD
ncbi:MAG: alkaline phosphatase family protein [Myxococcales bacterium]|nr:alkaline phosphatase family protein [Myxococcales bacterium]